MGNRGSTCASVGRMAGKSEGNGCLPGFKNNKSVNLDSRVDEQTVRGVARAFRDKREDINQLSGHFSSKFDMDHTYCIHLHSLIRSFKRYLGSTRSRGSR